MRFVEDKWPLSPGLQASCDGEDECGVRLDGSRRLSDILTRGSLP